MTAAADVNARADEASATCWACGAGGAAPLDAYRPLPFHRCASCGFVFQPQSRAADCAALYGRGYFRDYDLAETDTAADRRFEADVRVRLLRRRLLGGSVLEIGPAAGYFLDALRRNGFQPLGVEVSAEIAEAARRRFGVEMLVGAVEDVPLEPESFDAACAWHVVEHIPDPLRSLEAIRAALRPGSPLLVEVPNFGGMRSRREGPEWPSLEPRFHVGQYGPESLRALLERAGLAVELVETVPFAVYRRPLRAALSHAKHTVLTRAWPLGAHPWKRELLRAVARRTP